MQFSAARVQGWGTRQETVPGLPSGSNKFLGLLLKQFYFLIISASLHFLLLNLIKIKCAVLKYTRRQPQICNWQLKVYFSLFCCENICICVYVCQLSGKFWQWATSYCCIFHDVFLFRFYLLIFRNLFALNKTHIHIYNTIYIFINTYITIYIYTFI